MNEDEKLVNEVLKGNIDSFNIIINKYEIVIMKFIYSIVRDREAVEDIAQDVFITVYNKLYLYNNKYKFLNWIFQIAKNKCIDYVRKYKRVFESNIEDEINISSKEMSPEDAAEYKEVKKLVSHFINTLGDTDKQIIALRYTNEMTFRDIGVVLNINESTVKKRYYKIRNKYKEYTNSFEKRCNL